MNKKEGGEIKNIFSKNFVDKRETIMRVTFFISVTVFLLSLLAVPLNAQAGGVFMNQELKEKIDDSPVEAAPGFGLASESVLALDAYAFMPYDQVAMNAVESNFGLRYCTELCALEAQVTLPSGALVTAVELDAYDNNANGNVSGALGYCPIGYPGCSPIIFVGTDGTPGATQVYGTIGTPPTINNRNYTYIVEIVINGTTLDTALRGFRIFYKLQVSPSPGTATFSDVPTSHPFFQYVEALVASGITAGCGGGNYCPDSSLTRGQMAVFLSKALGLHWPN